MISQKRLSLIKRLLIRSSNKILFINQLRVTRWTLKAYIINWCNNRTTFRISSLSLRKSKSLWRMNWSHLKWYISKNYSKLTKDLPKLWINATLCSKITRISTSVWTLYKWNWMSLKQNQLSNRRTISRPRPFFLKKSETSNCLLRQRQQHQSI